jgi:hypothetical protein
MELGEDLDLCLVLVRGDMLHRRRAERDAHVGRHAARLLRHDQLAAVSTETEEMN